MAKELSELILVNIQTKIDHLIDSDFLEKHSIDIIWYMWMNLQAGPGVFFLQTCSVDQVTQYKKVKVS